MTARAGTGALAQRLLEHHPRGDCRHVDLELSPRLYGLARSRLQRLTPRAELLLGDGSLWLSFESGEFDRCLATHVLDLLSPDDIRLGLAETQHLVAPGGLLCLISLTNRRTETTRLLLCGWEWLWAPWPALVGGCRAVGPLRLPIRRLGAEHSALLASAGIGSEVLVAHRHADEARKSEGSGPPTSTEAYLKAIETLDL